MKITFHDLFQRTLAEFRQRFGVTGHKNHLYVGWNPPLNRRIVRSMARDKARRLMRDRQLPKKEGAA